MLVCAILACGCMAFADDNYSCPTGSTARAPRADDPEHLINNATIERNCTNNTNTYNSGQNHTEAGAKASFLGGMFGASGKYSRDGETSSNSSTDRQCSTYQVKYVCEEDKK